MTTDRHPFVDELVHRLSLSGDARWDDGKITFTRVRDATFDEPVVIEVDEAGVAAAVDISPDTRDALWPGADLMEAGFNLLLVNLGELIDTGRVPIRITAAGIEAPESSSLVIPDLPVEDGPFSLHAPLSGATYPPRRKRRGRRG